MNCSLVSHDWLSESRTFLLRNVKILDRKSRDLFVSGVLHSDRLRPWLTSIHRLNFGFLGSPAADETFILDMSEHLSNLNTIIWQGLHWSEVGHWHSLRPEVFSALGKFDRLRNLEIVDTLFASFEELKTVIVAFSSISTLSLFRVVCRNFVTADESSSTAPPTALSRLYLSTYNTDSQMTADDVLLWLHAAPTRHPIEGLSIDLCNLASALLLIADASLASLDVHMDDAHEILGKFHLISYPSARHASHTSARSQGTMLRPRTYSRSSRKSVTSSSSASDSS